MLRRQENNWLPNFRFVVQVLMPMGKFGNLKHHLYFYNACCAKTAKLILTNHGFVAPNETTKEGMQHV